jgi:hypothetical protein
MRFTRKPFLTIFICMKKLLMHTMPLVAVLLSAACHRNDIRTETFRIEQLRSQEGVQLIAQALQPLPGIREIRPNFEEHTLTVVFNGREIFLKNIEYAIVHAGFSLPNRPAPQDAIAKLPEELRP